MFKVLIRDNMDPIAKQILEATGKIDVTVNNDKTFNNPEKLSEIIGEYHGLGVRSGTQVTETVLKNAKNLKVIGRAGVGVDNINIKASTRQGVVVMNAPGGNTITTAEHAVSMMMALARNIPQATASLRSGKWEKKKLSGVEITGKTLGIIGLGQIGKIIANRAAGLQMKVLASDPFINPDTAKKINIELVSLDELYQMSDFITLHVPKLKETINMINSSSIKKMKPGVRLINCSRGEIVDVDSLFQAISSGHVAGAALDVFPTEPPDFSMPLLQHPNIIFTPHLGASTGEAQIKVAEMIAHQMAAYLTNDVITHAINFPSVSKTILQQIKPYLDQAEKMGSIMGQVIREIRDITITYSGETAGLDTRPITNALLKGFLSSFTDKAINYINAPAIAADKGIQIKETTSKTVSDFSGLIQLKLKGKENGPSVIWGTIFSKQHPRIVRLGKIYMDAIPEGSMIIIQNIDKPGVIGNLGTLLGDRNINIARFQLGRRDGKALCMVNIDSPADDSVIEEILSLPNIISATQVKLD